MHYKDIFLPTCPPKVLFGFIFQMLASASSELTAIENELGEKRAEHSKLSKEIEQLKVLS